MKLELTTEWPLERVAAYGPQITAAMKKLIAKFPEDATLQSMTADMMNGHVQLWLMLDDADDFKGIVLTDVRSIEATGHKSVRIVGLAGIDGVELCPHIETIEQWAWEQGAQDVLPVGRLGWKKPLSKLGYRVDRIVYRKDRPQ
ncbi:hypothetical protein PH562_16735 [Rhizobium sp. CNPSo 4062]|uniref:hypothetical protein n=1 Tax=Rhizobium sp. CNPSo 4062 TaxID=3021410 RepID=UPI00254AD60D|nr:hypothetical protein [Rhizobium sp. CNPSo 4062]MDK4703899.1 hypothetical protein [Rhizobium sp. CNPSo 4062]